MTTTPIEILADILEQKLPTSDVLVPEQCMIVHINGKSYHVTIEEFPDHEA